MTSSHANTDHTAVPSLTERPFWIGGRLIEPRLNQITHEGKTIAVERQVMQVLLYLADRPEQAVTREDILRAVWAGTAPNDEGLTQAISKLRKVLGDDPRTPSLIQTIRKVGYRLLVPVTLAETSSPLPQAAHFERHGEVPKHSVRIRIHGNWIVAAALVMLVVFGSSVLV